MKKVVIIGDSGHSKVVADIVNSNEDSTVFAKLDDKYNSVFIECGLLKGPIAHLETLMKMEPELGVVFGIGSNLIRKKIYEQLSIAPEKFITLIHNSAVVSPSANLGVGIVVMPNVVINADAEIGDHVILNSGSVVEHDCFIESYTHLSPLAVLTGGVRVGEGTHIGANACVIPMIEIGAWSIVGAGAVVVSTIEDGVTVVGTPARVVKREGS